MVSGIELFQSNEKMVVNNAIKKMHYNQSSS